MDFERRVAIVTGAASGVGIAALRLFAAAGATVVAADLNREGADAAAKSLNDDGFNAASVQVDISNEDSVQSMTEAVVGRFGQVNLLFNNAGIGPSSTNRYTMANVVDTPEDAWDAILAINLKGPALVCRHVIPELVKTGGGCIVNNSSINALVAVDGADAYTAAKGGLVALTRAMAVEWASHGVRVNCVCPGPIDTPMNAPWTEDPDRLKFLERNCPMGRIATAREVAEVAVFLCSSGASYINGAVIPVDGGWTAV